MQARGPTIIGNDNAKTRMRTQSPAIRGGDWKLTLKCPALAPRSIGAEMSSKAAGAGEPVRRANALPSSWDSQMGSKYSTMSGVMVRWEKKNEKGRGARRNEELNYIGSMRVRIEGGRKEGRRVLGNEKMGKLKEGNAASGSSQIAK